MTLKEEQNLKLPESDYNTYLQSRSAWRRWLDKFLYRFGYIHVRKLDYARDINKRLDEQRETIRESLAYLQEQTIKLKKDVHNRGFNLPAELVEYVIKMAKHYKIHIINLASTSEMEDMHKMLDSDKYTHVANIIERHAITPEQLGKTREEVQQFIAKSGEAS